MARDPRVLSWIGCAVIASVLGSACVVPAGSSAKRVREPRQGTDDAPDVRPHVSARSMGGEWAGTVLAASGDGEDASARLEADPPGEPLRGVEEGLAPKAHDRLFARRVDRTRIEARGASRIRTGLSTTALQAAVTLDNEQWRGEERRELLAYLRSETMARGTAFTPADARVVARLQAGSGALIDGELNDETMAVLFAMGFGFSAEKATAREVRLEFYPGELEDLATWTREIDTKVAANGWSFRDVNAPDGEGRIYVYVGGSIVASYRARGGPPAPLRDDGQHVAAPTKPGTYRLGPGHAHVTSNWYYSQIPWGAEIRRNGGGYEYRWPGRSEWSWATSDPAGKLKLPLASEDFEGLPEVTRADGATFLIWDKNDFGPIAWNLVPSDMYVHTTPDAETASEPGPETLLPVSHGCIHIAPRDRDEMMKRGYLRATIPFVVRRWDEHLLPDEVRHEMLRRDKS